MKAPPRALPARYYTDRDIYDSLRERLLMRSWHYAGHVSMIPQTGDYHAFTLLDQDLFIVRGRDGAVRCFYNVCQHRAHALVSGDGRARVIVCPYHAWSYELDGGLRAAPGTAGQPGFDRAAICLTAVRADIFLGFIFVNFDDGAVPLTESHADVARAARALCPDIESRVFAHEHQAQEHCNWLVAVENYNECYHCGHVHKAFSGGVVDPESYDIQPLGAACVLHHHARVAQGEGRWYDATDDYGSFFLFPLFSLQIYPGGVVNIYYWRPLAPGDTMVHRGWFSADGAIDDRLQQVIDLDRETTFAEDLLLVRAVQRGLGSRGYRPGPLVIAAGGAGVNSEHSIAALHSWVRQALEDSPT